MHKLQQTVNDSESLRFYSKEQKEDFLYDIEKASDAIVQWKAHIMRAVNQECAKQDILAELDQNSCLLVMDWAMKFLQLICMAREGSAGTSLAYLEMLNCKVRFVFSWICA